VIVYDLRLHLGAMDDFDPKREAEAAMKLAAAADGPGAATPDRPGDGLA
jgi:hypothetical protein